MHHRTAVLLSIALLSCAGSGDRPAAQSGPRAQPGIDVLLADSAHLLAGRRIGLITNQTGVDARGTPTIDRLFRQPGARLAALFAPEHGIRGTARPGERVTDTVDVATELPIYSLYGANRAPTREQLAAVDVVVVDLQDVGARTFTYISTTIHAMRAAAAAGKRIIVLDRPNPIGCATQGPVLDPANASFIGMLPVPLRHGMTIGELARFANGELDIGADLVVVPVRGWRCEWYDSTGLPWVRPSPNLPDLEAVAWYPGTVLFEATNLSVGRGTDAPFRQIGAPWFDAREAQSLVRPHLAALFTSFTPDSPGDGKFASAWCRGLLMPPFDRRSTDPIAAGLELLRAAAAANPDSLRVDARGLALRLGVAWRVGDPLPADGWAADRERFRQRAQRYFLYPRR